MALLARRSVRLIWRLLADAPFAQPKSYHDLFRELRWQVAMTRPEVQAQRFLDRPGDGPFRGFGVGHGVGVGHVPIGDQNENILQATSG